MIHHTDRHHTDRHHTDRRHAVRHLPLPMTDTQRRALARGVDCPWTRLLARRLRRALTARLLPYQVTTDGYVVGADGYPMTESASPYIEDFETGTLHANYAGDTGDCTVASGAAAHDGSYGCEVTPPDPGYDRVYWTGSATVATGTEYEYWFYAGSDGAFAVEDPGPILLTDDTHTTYLEFYFDTSHGTAYRIRETGESVFDVAVGSTLPTDAWTRWVCALDRDGDGQPTLTVDDGATTTYLDDAKYSAPTTSFTTGGHGWMAGATGGAPVMYVDSIRAL